MTTDPLLENTEDEFSMAPVLSALAGTLPPVVPSKSLKERILDAVPKFVFAQKYDFRPTPIPGIEIRVVRQDSARNMVSAFLRLAPGAKLDTHIHEGVEECVVLSGEILVGSTRMVAGDYQRSEPGTLHEDQISPNGAVVYITGPLSLLQMG